MICPNCRADNPGYAEYCFNCRTQLNSQNSALSSNQPAWLNSNSTPKSNGNDTVSIEELLKATEGAFLGKTSSQPTFPTPPPVSPYSVPASVGPGPSYGTYPNIPSPMASNAPDYTLGGMSFQSQSAQTGAANSAYGGSPYGQQMPPPSGMYVAPPLPYAMPGSQNTEEEAGAWVENGVFYFTDQYGYTASREIAGFWRRFFGAVIDGIVTNIVTFIITFAGTLLILSGNARQLNQVRSVSFSNLTGILLPILILAVVAGIILPLCYYVILVGVSGQTLGHRAMGIEVVSKKGPGVSFGRSILRAAYGIPITLFLNERIESWGVLQIFALVLLLGMAWAAFDNGKQGLHDKLAGTYMVYVQR